MGLRVEEMINCAIEKAREVYRKYPLMKFSLDIEKITADEGCEIVTWPFVYPVREVKRGRYIGTPEELGRRRINDFGTETEMLRWKSLSLEER